MLSIVWIICCIPVLTIGSATAALYYSVVKSVRKERGSPLKEFFSAFKTNLKQGIFLTFIMLAIALLVVLNIYSADLTQNNNLSDIFVVLSRFVLLLGIFVFRYLFAILSRFTYKTAQYFKVSCAMAFKHIFTSLLLTLLFIVVIEAVYIFPIIIIIAPGVTAYIDSLLIERVFRRYMSRVAEGEEVPFYWL